MAVKRGVVSGTGFRVGRDTVCHHPKDYAEGVFRGFVVDPQGRKP